MNAKPLSVRDFIYLDVDRLKSIVAQLEGGLLEQTATATGSSKSLEGGAEAGIPGLAKVGGTGQYVWTDQASETRTLHDHIYNYVEGRLREKKQLLVFCTKHSIRSRGCLTNNERNCQTRPSYL